MEFNELFEKYSLKDITSKTNIPKEKLNSLKEKKWEDFIKPQVIGFLNILKREYDVDVSNEIEEVKEFFKNRNTNNTITSIDMVDSAISNNNEGYFLSKIIYLLSILALAYAGWYYYNKEVKSATIQVDNNSSIISNTIDNVKNIVDVEQKSSNQEVNSSFEKKEAKKDIENIKKEESKIDSIKEVNSIKDSTKIDTYSNKDKNESNLSLVEVNSTSESISNENRDIKQVVNKLLEENKSNEQISNESNLEENKTLDANVNIEDNNLTNNTIEQESNATTFESATIVSIAKNTWVGIYNLKSKNRLTKVLKRDKKFTLDLNRGDYAIVTGHNKFKVLIGDEEKLFPKRGRVYFYISKEDGLKIIDKKEYKKITNKKAW